MARLTALLVMMMTLGSLQSALAQPDEDQLGGWYMYFWSVPGGETETQGRFGLQGDIQYRNWDAMGDLEQLLLRGGVTYRPKQIKAKLTLGYAYISTGEFGDGSDTVAEHRIYQEALLPHKLAGHLYLTHRFRYEQRIVETPDLRTRYRYALFINVPLNQANLKKGAIYLAAYDEVFINGQRGIGDGISVQFFDRNRAYGALGYSILDTLRVQAGYMQQTTTSWSKGQFQLSLHHTID